MDVDAPVPFQFAANAAAPALFQTAEAGHAASPACVFQAAAPWAEPPIFQNRADHRAPHRAYRKSLYKYMNKRKIGLLSTFWG